MLGMSAEENISSQEFVTESRRKLYNNQLRNLYISTIIRAIKWKKLRWAGHLARMTLYVHIQYVDRNPVVRGHLEDLALDLVIIMNYFLME